MRSLKLAAVLCLLSIRQADAGEIISVAPREIVSSLTLDKLSSLAVTQNPQVHAAASAVEVARGEAGQAGLYPNPVLSSGANQLGGRDSQYYFTLSQEIVTKHKLGLDRAAATQQVFQAEFDYVKVRFEVLTELRRDFYALLAAQRRVEILEQLVTLLTQSRDASERLRKGGEGTKADVLLLDVQLQQAQVALENAGTMREAYSRKLAASAGDRLLTIDSVEGDLAGQVVFPDQNTAREWMMQENAAPRHAMAEVQRREILLQRSVVEPFPNFNVTAGYQGNVSPLHNLAIVQLEFPIPVWNRNQGNIRAARAQVTRAAQTLESIRNTLSRQLAEAWGQFNASQQQVDKFETQILPTSREAIQISQQGYEQGEFDFLRLLQAQQTRVRAELEYVSSLEAKWLTAATIAGMLQLEEFPPTAVSCPLVDSP